MRDWMSHKRAIDSIWVDVPYLIVFIVLCLFGLLMVASASLELGDKQYGNSWHFVVRHAVHLMIALLAAMFVYFIPSQFWFRHLGKILIATGLLLVVVLLFGPVINGSRRWLLIGSFSLQPSEAAKLSIILFVSSYIARHGIELRHSFKGLLKPIAVVSTLVLLLLLEPDYGTAVIVFAIMTGMLFLAGTSLWRFTLYLAGGIGILGLLARAAPYRWERFNAFLDPWNHSTDQAYQLVQSLIAIGRGSWFGQGLGDSIQKQFYLPEAHTDFIFSVIAEELGFVGVFAVMFCYLVIVWRCFTIAQHAEEQNMPANAYTAYGIGIWIGLQAFVNIAVAIGALPTKGITLPLISVGGSSLVILSAAFALTQRIHYESCCVNPAIMRHHYQERRDARS